MIDGLLGAARAVSGMEESRAGAKGRGIYPVRPPRDLQGAHMIREESFVYRSPWRLG
jgi:hypothetical protein